MLAARFASTTEPLATPTLADEAYVTRALQAGATGYMLKDSAGKDLLKGIASVAKGLAYFSPAIARLMHHAMVTVSA